MVVVIVEVVVGRLCVHACACLGGYSVSEKEIQDAAERNLGI